MTKILFLDFDGVLHPNLCDERDWFCRMPLLEASLSGRDASIVSCRATRKARGNHPLAGPLRATR